MPVDRPTFSESWYRVAELRPRLRPTVQIHRQHFRGQMWHVIQDPSNNQFFRLNDAAYRFVAMLDGRKNVAEVWKICNEQLGDNAPTQGEAIQLLGQLYVSNLLLTEVSPDSEGLFKRYKKRIGREVRGYLTNLLFIRLPIFDPDRFLTRWVGVFGRLFSVFGLALLVGLICTGFYFLAGRWGELFSDTNTASLAGMTSGGGGKGGILSVENLPYLYACFTLVKILHEFGHAFSCKKFGLQEGSGGEVHVMGIMVMVFTPFPYVDASSSWAFRSKWHRAVVGAAGVLVELGIASVAAIVWSHTSDELVSKLAYNVMFIASVSTVLFNGNPLLRYDGYYILSDLLEIPNLAQRSKEYIYYLVRKYAWGVRQVRNPAHTPGERGWMLAYGLCSTAYRVVICVAILLFVADQLFLLGAVLALAAAVAWLLVPLGKFLHYLFSSNELMRHRTRAVGSTAALLAAVVGFIGLVQWPQHVNVDSIVRADPQIPIRAQESGFVESALPTDLHVSPDGPPLVVCRNPELRAQREMLAAELKRLSAVRGAVQKDPWQRDVVDQQLAACKSSMTNVEKQLASLEIHAPVPAMWIAPNADNLKGSYIKAGDPVGLVADLDKLTIVAVVSQDVAGDEAQVGDRCELRVYGRPPKALNTPELTGRIVKKIHAAQQELPSPALGIQAGGSVEVADDDRRGTKAAERFFEFHIVPDDPAAFMVGQRVVVRLSLPHKPLAAQWWRSIQQLIQRRFHI